MASGHGRSGPGVEAFSFLAFPFREFCQMTQDRQILLQRHRPFGSRQRKTRMPNRGVAHRCIAKLRQGFCRYQQGDEGKSGPVGGLCNKYPCNRQQANRQRPHPETFANSIEEKREPLSEIFEIQFALPLPAPMQFHPRQAN